MVIAALCDAVAHAKIDSATGSAMCGPCTVLRCDGRAIGVRSSIRGTTRALWSRVTRYAMSPTGT